MKFAVWIILGALAIGIFAPPSLPFLIDQHQESAIGVLDVCHAATPAISAGGEMPCVGEGIRSITSPLFRYASIQTLSVSPQFVYSLVDEHPPQA